MLDIKAILADPDGTIARLRTRSPDLSIDDILELGERRRETVGRFSTLRHEQKEVSSGFARGDMPPEEKAALRDRLKGMSDEVKALENQVKELDEALESALLLLPNLPSAETPVGRSEADNPVLRTWGEVPSFDFEPQDHDVLGESLGILDFEAASRISGARFALYRGAGARLERSLATFMLNLHTEQHGYEEVLPPYLVLRHCMVGTGQLPKLEEDAFRAETDDLFLIPTAEVPVTNMHREQMLDGADLPYSYAAYSSCFRREAGSYGKDTRGLTRLHQFQKVEMVHFTRPEDSEACHQTLTGHAEAVLQALGLPYRVVELCTGDLGFSAQRCYDLEVWLAGQKVWREISSCSNFGDFQARRASIRYRPAPGEKPRFVHTLNGSGLAIGRTVMALMEHYQQADGSILIPEVLQPLMGTDRIAPPS
ncbi:MAG: serine--tRNA ligase [Myxococcota bacterium]|nr:serine--tRNA ligase [Myxococcota bacterium]